MLLKMERISWPQGSRVQASSRPEAKRPVVQSPRFQSSRVQGSSHPESKSLEPKCTESKGPDYMPRGQIFWYVFLNVVIQTSMLFIATGFVTMFRNNVETSLSCLFIQLTNSLTNQLPD